MTIPNQRVEIYNFSSDEWVLFTETEKKIIILARQYDIADHDRIRLLLNWPLDYPKNKQTYNSQWSRLMAKMRKINQNRLTSKIE